MGLYPQKSGIRTRAIARATKTLHPGVELRANLKSISHKCHLYEVVFVWELTKETIHLPLGCLQGASTKAKVVMPALTRQLLDRAIVCGGGSLFKLFFWFFITFEPKAE